MTGLQGASRILLWSGSMVRLLVRPHHTAHAWRVHLSTCRLDFNTQVASRKELVPGRAHCEGLWDLRNKDDSHTEQGWPPSRGLWWGGREAPQPPPTSGALLCLLGFSHHSVWLIPTLFHLLKCQQPCFSCRVITRRKHRIFFKDFILFRDVLDLQQN